MDIYKISVTFLFVRMTIQAVMKEYDTQSVYIRIMVGN